MLEKKIRRMRNLGFAVVFFFGLIAMAGLAQNKVNDNIQIKNIVKIEAIESLIKD